MKHFLLFYELADDYLERRPQFRSGHLKYAWEAHGRVSWSLPALWRIPPMARC